MERHIKNINLLTRSVNDALEMCLKPCWMGLGTGWATIHEYPVLRTTFFALLSYLILK